MKKQLLAIAPADTVEELRKNVLLALQKIVEHLPDPSDAMGQRLRNLADPTANNDAVTKKYVDTQVSASSTTTDTSDFVRGASGLSIAGAVPFVKSAGRLGIDPTKFVWDPVNYRLAIGNSSASFTLDVTGTGHFTSNVVIGGALDVTGSVKSSNKFIIGADDGVTTTITQPVSLNVSTAADGVFGTPGVLQSNGTVVTAVSINFGSTHHFVGGIIID